VINADTKKAITAANNPKYSSSLLFSLLPFRERPIQLRRFEQLLITFEFIKIHHKLAALTCSLLPCQ
jgi:hypothetical protein